MTDVGGLLATHDQGDVRAWTVPQGHVWVQDSTVAGVCVDAHDPCCHHGHGMSRVWAKTGGHFGV